MDLTVADAPAVRDFYAAVAGWTPAEVPMGEYSDYCMNAPPVRKPWAARLGTP
jgi:predicted enzyme related to lactoylglutathione lyase